ncbi:MAG: alpha/beta hydrolase family protein [Polyangiaceae bacterium]
MGRIERVPNCSKRGVRGAAPIYAVTTLLALSGCGDSGTSDGGDGGSAGSGAAGSGGSAGAAGSAGSSTGGSAGSTGGSGGAAGAGSWSFEQIGSDSAEALDQTWQVELWAAHRPDGNTSYLMYIPAKTPNARPVVLTQPYAGIDWTGEEMDQRWAQLGGGIHPDVDGPNYDGDDQIVYTPQGVQDAVNDAAIWLLNGRAAVHAYARFYAGGDLEDDILDATAPYYFLEEKASELDTQRVTTFGGSWGGMMALFGAARAPQSVTVSAIAAVAPPSDFADLATWATTDLPAAYPRPADAEAFFSPYLRRMRASVGEGPSADYSRYGLTALCSNLKHAAYVPHDRWDTLIPIRQTEAFEAACPNLVRPVYWYRGDPIDYDAVNLDHGLFGKETGYPTAYTFAAVYLGLATSDANEPVIAVGHPQAFVEFLTTIRAAQLASASSGEALDAVLQLADPRVQVFDLSTSTGGSGAAYVATGVNQVWGTSYTASDVASALSSGFPTP